MLNINSGILQWYTFLLELTLLKLYFSSKVAILQQIDDTVYKLKPRLFREIYNAVLFVQVFILVTNSNPILWTLVWTVSDNIIRLPSLLSFLYSFICNFSSSQVTLQVKWHFPTTTLWLTWGQLLSHCLKCCGNH